MPTNELQVHDDQRPAPLQTLEAGPEPLFVPSVSDVISEVKTEGRVLDVKRVNPHD